MLNSQLLSDRRKLTALRGITSKQSRYRSTFKINLRQILCTKNHKKESSKYNLEKLKLIKVNITIINTEIKGGEGNVSQEKSRLNKRKRA
jgi:hypothetical protein